MTIVEPILELDPERANEKSFSLGGLANHLAAKPSIATTFFAVARGALLRNLVLGASADEK